MSQHITPNPAVNQPTPDHLVTISSVDIDDQNDNLQVALTVTPPFSYRIAETEEPATITVEVQNAHFSDLPKVINIQRRGLTHVSLEQGSEPMHTARLHMHLKAPTGYQVKKESGRLVISLTNTFEVSSQPDQPATTAAPTIAFPPPIVPPATMAAFPRVLSDYRVGPGDVLDISVYGETDLTRSLRVTGEGFISFPLIGQINVRGLTTLEIEEELERHLAQGYLVNPQLTVAVAEYRSQQTLVLGAVQNPGLYALQGEATLLELLSRAGGLGRDGGHGKSLVLLRDHPAQKDPDGDRQDRLETIYIDLDRLLNQGDTSLNVTVKDQDVIYVPEPSSIVVFGEVINPGPIPVSDNMTLMQALSHAGGFTDEAAPSRIRIIRLIDGAERILRINVTDIIKRGDHSKNIILEPDDIVVVPVSIF